MSIVKLQLTNTTTVHDIIQLLDSSGVGILPIVDNENRLIGIVTDGDVRRSVLHGQLSVDGIINRNPKRLSDKTPKVEILRVLKQMHLRHMPIVDDRGQLVNIVFLENLAAESKNIKVIIMAGGLGSRLGTLTQETPKPMLPINGRPILEYIIENLRYQGFNRFILCLNHKAEIIKNYFGDGKKLNVEIEYTTENKRLGTAGALSLINPSSLNEPSIVLNADIVTNIDFQEVINFHNKVNSQATMCVKRQGYEIPYACVEFDENMEITTLVEKPKIDNYINAGIYILNPEILSLVPFNEFYDMTSLFQDVIKKRLKAKVFRFEDHWMDIGRPKDYLKANSEDIDV